MKKEQEVYINSETIAFQIAGILHEKNERIIDHKLVYQMVKELVKNEKIVDDVYRETISLLEDKYGILFDLDKQVNI